MDVICGCFVGCLSLFLLFYLVYFGYLRFVVLNYCLDVLLFLVCCLGGDLFCFCWMFDVLCFIGCSIMAVRFCDLLVVCLLLI